MAITVIGEKFDRPGTRTKEKMVTTRVFQVQTTDNESSVLVLEATGLPEINEGHPDNPKLICQQQQANPEVDADTWLVTCSYVPNSITMALPPGEAKPWDLPPFNITAGTVAYNKVLEKAYDEDGFRGEPVLNSAEDPFDPPVQYIEYHFSLKFSYNKRHFDLFYVHQYQGTVNEKKISVMNYELSEREGLLTGFTASKIDVNDSDGDYLYSYYQLDCEIEWTNDTWSEQVLDAGFYYKVGGVRKEIKLSSAGVLGNEGTAVTEPAKLDGAGGILAEGADPVYLEFLGFDSQDWQTLELPKTLEG